MSDRPILFSAPMVRALLAGTKTQTRRAVKFKPHHQIEEREDGSPWPWMYDGERDADHWLPCPYGQPGDRLWVKETWRTAASLDDKSPNAIGEMCIDAGYRKPWAPLEYLADGRRNSEWRGFEVGGDAQPGKTRVSIHMPRWASRISLEVTGVRVERLNDCSEADARAEGVVELPGQEGQPGAWWTGDVDRGPALHARTPVAAYRLLWDGINGPGSWDANPWVWVVEFGKAMP